MIRLVVEVEGGLVTGVYADPGEAVELYVCDRDTEASGWIGVKAVGSMPQVEVGRHFVDSILDEIAMECDYCDGRGVESVELQGYTAAHDVKCGECDGRGWWLPFAVPVRASLVASPDIERCVKG